MQIIYEPHPVTPERKAELRAQGYKILDAVFSPDGVQSAAKEDKPKRGRPAKVVTDAAGN
jgi:hypothetical protein